jgi:hypothetical protein
MSRMSLSAAALLLGLAAAPAFAQSLPAPEESTAVRTLEQNRRAFVPPPSRPQVAQDQPARDRPAAATLPSAAVRRLALADEPQR